MDEKRCARCHKMKEACDENFYREKAMKSGWSSWCKPCLAERRREMRRDAGSGARRGRPRKVRDFVAEEDGQVKALKRGPEAHHGKRPSILTMMASQWGRAVVPEGGEVPRCAHCNSIIQPHRETVIIGDDIYIAGHQP